MNIVTLVIVIIVAIALYKIITNFMSFLMVCGILILSYFLVTHTKFLTWLMSAGLSLINNFVNLSAKIVS